MSGLTDNLDWEVVYSLNNKGYETLAAYDDMSSGGSGSYQLLGARGVPLGEYDLLQVLASGGKTFPQLREESNEPEHQVRLQLRNLEVKKLVDANRVYN